MFPLRPLLGRFVHMPAAVANMLDRLPEEVILHILSYLGATDIVNLQSISSRYLALGRDDALWKTQCFQHSTAEALRRRQHRLNTQDPRLAEIRNAVAALPGGDLTAWDVAQLFGRAPERTSLDPAADARIQRNRALANWEPAYLGEQLDYYEEYIHRHGKVNVAWLHLPNSRTSDRDQVREATGIGLLSDWQDDTTQRAVAPLDDGSICIWDLSARSTHRSGGRGRILAQSRSGLLSGRAAEAVSESHTIMTETGAVECVAIASHAQKAYFGVQNLLQEVDLNTLQLISTKTYPFPVTALSEARERVPITVGTNMTVHLHDPRDPAFATSDTTGGGELIGGSVYSHATLAQPGPLSILNHDGSSNADSSIWVAGRFTSLLNYDRRFFPRLRGTVHSGARIANLSSLPYPFIPLRLNLQRNPNATLSALQEAKSSAGTTILAAAEYKGKGSLELYGLPEMNFYHNRQTASASKLLSVAPHGGRIVFSDGDGNLKWVERDGYSHIRTFNINNDNHNSSSHPLSPHHQQDQSRPTGIFSSTAIEAPGQGDIVQKILPMQPVSALSATSTTRTRPDINQNNLLLWTGDGRLGVLGFGNSSGANDGQWHEEAREQAQRHLSAEERAREDAERQYGMAMRRALERNADEVRFVRGLGMGYMR